MKHLATFDLEKELLASQYDLAVGIDEAGRGPLAGPVVASAVIVKNWEIENSDFSELIRDSKTLSEKQREKLYDFIMENFYVGIGMCDHETIDRINILEATYLAMKIAVSQLKSKIKKQNQNIIDDARYVILVDGNKTIPNLSMEQRSIINGDRLVKSISAASIVAKVTRDRIMKEMHEKYPEYDFPKHKGYGTRLHLEALRKHGPCKIHRKSFAPVRICLS